MSPASSADMAPISSGSSTWTSSGIPFSFVSMATGIGPSSSGSQATVASVVTSTLLAGLGFSGGVISSFPSFVWPSRTPTHNPTSTTKPTVHATGSSSAVTTASVKENHKAGSEDWENRKGQGEDGEREGEDKDEEQEEEKEEKMVMKASVGVIKVRIKDNITVVNEPPSKKPDSTAKEKTQTRSYPVDMLPSGAYQVERFTIHPLEFNPTATTEAINETRAFATPKDHTGTPSTERGRRHCSFSIHTGRYTNVLKFSVNSRHFVLLHKVFVF